MKSILCYGDSNTWGYNPEEDARYLWDERWPGMLKHYLGEGYQIIEDGLCGRTTQHNSETEQYVNGFQTALLTARIHQPIDIAVVMLGTNDCKDVYHAKPVTIAQGVRAIGKIFEKAGAAVFIVSPASVKELSKSPFLEEFGQEAEEKSTQLKKWYCDMAKSEGWSFLDADQCIYTGSYDRIHLDKDNHRRLAWEIYKYISRMEGNHER